MTSPAYFSMFPSPKHRERLIEKMGAAKFDEKTAFADATERWQWHHYDYAWRRVYLKDSNQSSDIDPQGQFYDPSGIKRAEEMFQRIAYRSRPVRRISAADQAEAEGYCDKASRYWQQTAMLMEANAKIAADGDGTGKNPDGSPTVLALEKVEVCMRIIRSNLSSFLTRATRGRVTEPTAAEPDSLAELQRMMGINAREEKPTEKVFVTDELG